MDLYINHSFIFPKDNVNLRTKSVVEWNGYVSNEYGYILEFSIILDDYEKTSNVVYFNFPIFEHDARDFTHIERDYSKFKDGLFINHSSSNYHDIRPLENFYVKILNSDINYFKNGFIYSSDQIMSYLNNYPNENIYFNISLHHEFTNVDTESDDSLKSIVTTTGIFGQTSNNFGGADFRLVLDQRNLVKSAV